jgi:hypothetical protein
MRRAAACALWFDIPLVTQDRDLEGIPGLRVLTLHDEWRIGGTCRVLVEGITPARRGFDVVARAEADAYCSRRMRNVC